MSINPDTELAPLLFTLFISVLLVGCYALARLVIFFLKVDYKSFLDTLSSLRSDASTYINYFEDLDDE